VSSRRAFISLLGGAMVAWPLTAPAQSDRVRRIGVLMAYAESDPEAQARVTAFLQGLQMTDSFLVAHRAEITSLAARHRLPAVYPFRFFVELGGLLSYGNDLFDSFRRAATYADRILKGATPNELPVQAPVKFELVINLKTAKALGLDVPLHLQQLADDVIE
jgi:ABC-type uncharacterized transport system substrate-binding protein